MTALDRPALSAAKRELLQRRLRGRAGPSGPAELPPVLPRSEDGPAPLSVSQEQLWYFGQLVPDRPVCNEAVTIRKDGAFNPAAFRRAFAELLRRHDIGQTTYPVVHGEAVALVGDPQFPLPLHDLSDLPADVAQARAAELVAEDFARPYDLTRGPLVRAHLVRLSAEHHRLYLGLHQIVFDGVTLYRVILPDLIRLYDDCAAGREPGLPVPSLSYLDYAVWERDWVSGPAVASRIDWWREHLAGAPTLALPLDHPRPAVARFRSAMEPFTLSRDLVEELRELGQRHGATLFHTLATAYAALLHRYSRQDDVVFGTVGDLRQRPELHRMAGYCLTPFVVRADLSGEPTFAELLRRVSTEVVSGLDHLVPFERLVRELRPVRDGAANPVLRANLVLEPKVWEADPEWSLHQLEVEIGNAVGTSKFDLALECDERPDGHISGRLSYDRDLFSAGTARQLVRTWQRLLRVLIDEPTALLSRVELVDEEERHRQLEAWNDAVAVPDVRSTVHALVEAQAIRAPDRVAVVHEQQQLTYGELDRRAEVVARRLRARGAGAGDVVAVCLERSLDMVVGLLGVLKSGAAYLPLDPGHPVERREQLVDDAQARLLLTSRSLGATGAAPAPGPAGPTVLLVEDDEPGDEGDRERAVPSAAPESTAYVMYTSGSTGRPKGVLVRHRNVVGYINSVLAECGLGADDAVLALATYTFDIFVADVFPTLAVGARIVLAGREEALDARRLACLIESSGTTRVNATPVIWQGLLDAGWPGSRHLVASSGGDALSDALAQALLPRVGELWNNYGPTETTCSATRAQILPGDAVTLGRPILGTRVYVLDDHQQLLPPGVVGEICIAGSGVAVGYLRRPEETARRFCPDPFVAGATLYRSGDLGRHLPDGRLQYLGRADDQVKVRGIRIEPGEIEVALLDCPGVSAAVVTASGDGSDRRLTAYVVPSGGAAVTTAELRVALRRVLPEYMVPAAFVVLEVLPTTTSGKVDRQALPAPDVAPVVDEVAIGRMTPLEQDLAGVWARVLGLPSVAPDAGFFDLGGHSLLAVRLLVEVERTLSVVVPLNSLFRDGATVRGMAAGIEDARSKGRPSHQPAEGEAWAGRGVLTLFFVHPHAGTVPATRHFTGPLGPALPVDVLVPERPGGVFDRSRSIEQMAVPLLDALRATQPTGPYLLAGYSLGGLLAYELARQLTAAGEEVAWLGLLDSGCATGRARRRSQRELLVLYARRGPLVLLRQCLSALRRERQKLRMRLRPDPEVFDLEGADHLASHYVAEPVDAPLAVFGTDTMVHVQGFGPTLGWQSVHAGPVEFHEVPGTHESLLLTPHVERVAEVFSRSLREAAAGAALR